MPKDFKTKDSGKRQHFTTGSRRDSNDGKGAPELLSPYSWMRVAGVAERGASKYSKRNYEKGQPQSRYIQSALRHLLQVLMGKTDEDHAGQAAWNILAFMHQEELIERGLLDKKLDDMPHYETRTQEEFKKYLDEFEQPTVIEEK